MQIYSLPLFDAPRALISIIKAGPALARVEYTQHRHAGFRRLAHERPINGIISDNHTRRQKNRHSTSDLRPKKH